MTAAKTLKHTWQALPLGGNVGLSLWNSEAGYSLTLQFTPAQARAIARELIEEADRAPRLGTPADLGCTVL